MNRQTNVQRGLRPVNSGEALTDKGLYLVTAVDGGSILEVLLPTAVDELSLYLVEEGNALDTNSIVRPLEAGDQIRIKAKGTGSAGAVLVHADPATAADKGKVRSIPATAGRYFSPGVAEEDFVDGQDVLVRVLPRIVTVATTVDLTSSNGTAAGAADLAALKVESEKIGDDVRAIHAALVTAGLIATS